MLATAVERWYLYAEMNLRRQRISLGDGCKFDCAFVISSVTRLSTTDLSVFRLIYIHTLLLLTDVASDGGSLIQLTSVHP